MQCTLKTKMPSPLEGLAEAVGLNLKSEPPEKMENSVEDLKIVPIEMHKRSPKFRDVTGAKYGRLAVLGFGGFSNGGISLWVCKCECGTQRAVSIGNLRSGHTRSCGCLARETTSKCSQTHGMSKTREYHSWTSMRQRCYYRKNNRYYAYGARGITVCERWKESFELFFKDMGTCPDGCSIERIDLDGNYEPSNCKWGTQEEQSSNRSDNRIVTCDGVSMAAFLWDKKMGLNPGTVKSRLHKGWTPERAVTQPMGKTR